MTFHTISKKYMPMYFNDRITQSQNSWSWQGPPESTLSYPQAQNLLELVAQRILESGLFAASPGNLFQCLKNLTVEKHHTSQLKSVLLCSDRTFCISVCVHCFSSLGTNEKRLALSPSWPHQHIVKTPQAFFSPGWTLTVFWYSACTTCCSSPITNLMALGGTCSITSMSFHILRSPPLDRALRICLNSDDQMEGSSLLTCWQHSAIASQRLMTTFATKAHSWFMFNLISTRILGSFSARLLSSQPAS